MNEGTQGLQSFLDHLRLCEDCWGAWLAWRCLESEGGVQPGDEQIVARAAARALRVLRKDQPRLRRTTWAAAVTAVLLVGTMASAGVRVYRWRAERREKIAVPVESRTASRSHVLAPSVAVAPVTRVVEDVEPPPTPRPSEPTTRARPTRPAPMKLAATDPRPWDPAVGTSAAALFAEAIEARRTGKREAAISAFRLLQSTFSETPEAIVSLVSLAEMLTQSEVPQAALPLFDAYLARAPEGPLCPEALVGKARVLEHLGRTGEARAVYLEIGRRMPESFYAPERSNR